MRAEEVRNALHAMAAVVILVIHVTKQVNVDIVTVQGKKSVMIVMATDGFGMIAVPAMELVVTLFAMDMMSSVASVMDPDIIIKRTAGRVMAPVLLNAMYAMEVAYVKNVVEKDTLNVAHVMALVSVGSAKAQVN